MVEAKLSPKCLGYGSRFYTPRAHAGFGHGKNYNLTFSGAGTIIGGSSCGQWDKFNRPPDISSLCPLSPKTDEKCKVAILTNFINIW